MTFTAYWKINYIVMFGEKIKIISCREEVGREKKRLTNSS